MPQMYPGKECELDISVHRLEHSVERFQCTPVCILQFRTIYGLKHRLVVFVDKDHYPLSGLLTCPLDYSGKAE